jgi:hypothetical protein
MGNSNEGNTRDDKEESAGNKAKKNCSKQTIT